MTNIEVEADDLNKLHDRPANACPSNCSAVVGIKARPWSLAPQTPMRLHICERVSACMVIGHGGGWTLRIRSAVFVETFTASIQDQGLVH